MEFSVMSIFTQVFGGLGLFLFGMHLMSEGLEKAAGNRLKSIIGALTKNRFIGVGVGAFVTTVVQSSSATTVMIVGFVNAGLMTLNQAIGLIMGANIGTTTTALMVSLKLTKVAPIAVGLGVMFLLFSKDDKIKKYAQIMIGFGIIFIGMDTMKAAMKVLREAQVFDAYLTSFGSGTFVDTVSAVFAGFAVTAIVQSSSATTGILVGMAATGMISLDAAFPILLGTNIGTCVTALISSIGTNKVARRAAIMHLIFNVIGTAMFGLFFSKWTLAYVKSTNLPIDMQVAVTHAIFNIVTTFVLIWFAPIIVKISTKIIKETDDERKGVMGIKYIDERILETPSIAIGQVMREVLHMGNIVNEEFKNSLEGFLEKDRDKIAKAFELEKVVNSMESDISEYLVKLSNAGIDSGQREVLDSLFNTINDIERIGDHADNIAEMAAYRMDGNLSFSQKALDELVTMSERVVKSYKQSMTAMKTGESSIARSVIEREGEIDLMERNLRKLHIKRLNDGKCQPTSGIIFLDVISNLERIGDHASNIALAVLDTYQEA